MAVFNVRDFGAAGNGTTDDTVAIATAIGFAANTPNQYAGAVYFPAGKYLVSDGTAGPQQYIRITGASGNFTLSIVLRTGLTPLVTQSIFYNTGKPQCHGQQHAKRVAGAARHRRQ